MALPLFPSVPYGFPIKIKPTFKTIIGKSVSGREVRFPNQPYSLWEMELTFEVLRDQTQNQVPYAPEAGFTDFMQLCQLFLMMYGQLGLFYFDAFWDNSRTNQLIGIGDGSTVTFGFYRTWGEAASNLTEPIGGLNSLSQVQVNGVTVSPSDYNYSANEITFGTAPGVGQPITATFSFFYCCRFLDDIEEFEEFYKDIWQVKSLKIRSIRALYPAPPAPTPPSNGNLAVTLGALTLSATATVPTPPSHGTLAITLGALTLSATATNPVPPPPIHGNLAVTLGALTLSARATNPAPPPPIHGNLEVTLGALTLSATATNPAPPAPSHGSLAITLGTLTLSATATVPPARHGSLAVTLGALTLSATATNPIGVGLANDGQVLILTDSTGYPTNGSGAAGTVWNNGTWISVVPGITPNPSAPAVYFGIESAGGLLALGGGNLPLSDPLNHNQLWNNAGVICISA